MSGHFRPSSSTCPLYYETAYTGKSVDQTPTYSIQLSSLELLPLPTTSAVIPADDVPTLATLASAFCLGMRHYHQLA